jgi:hypothetical protein
MYRISLTRKICFGCGYFINFFRNLHWHTLSVLIPFGLSNELCCNIMICIIVSMILCLGRRFGSLWWAADVGSDQTHPKSAVVLCIGDSPTAEILSPPFPLPFVDRQTTVKQLDQNSLTSLLQHTRHRQT